MAMPGPCNLDRQDGPKPLSGLALDSLAAALLSGDADYSSWDREIGGKWYCGATAHVSGVLYDLTDQGWVERADYDLPRCFAVRGVAVVHESLPSKTGAEVSVTGHADFTNPAVQELVERAIETVSSDPPPAPPAEPPTFEALCKATGLSDEDLAAKVGLTPKTLREYVRTGKPSQSVLELVVNLLKVAA